MYSSYDDEDYGDYSDYDWQDEEECPYFPDYEPVGIQTRFDDDTLRMLDYARDMDASRDYAYMMAEKARIAAFKRVYIPKGNRINYHGMTEVVFLRSPDEKYIDGLIFDTAEDWEGLDRYSLEDLDQMCYYQGHFFWSELHGLELTKEEQERLEELEEETRVRESASSGDDDEDLPF